VNKYKGDKSNSNFKFLESYLPKEIPIWVEPFGGSFGLFRLFKSRIKYSIYNDKNTNVYNLYKDQSNISYNEDFRYIIDKYDSPNTFFYFDPPYFGKEHYYEGEFTILDHIQLNEYIKNLDGDFILSYNDCPFIRELYKDFIIENIPYKDIYHKSELIIYNVK
jgi:site-specific DNA-adenine methylase